MNVGYMNQPRFFRTGSIVLLIIMCVILFHILGVLTFIERPLANVLHLASREVYTLNVWEQDTFVPYTMDEEELRIAFLAVQKKYRNAIVDETACTLLKEEHVNIKKQLAFFAEKEWVYITTRVTGKRIDPFESGVVLFLPDAARVVSIGAPVITADGIFVGIVTQIEGDVVSVRLLDDGRTKVGGALLNNEKTVGVVEGGFGKSIRMNFIPQHENISVGDIVVSSGLSEHVPYGLPIGTVESVEKEPYQPFQSATITPLVNPNTLSIVSIIIEKEI
ncbi:MAG: hypothetical protein COV60_00600 [Candidatus Magasanikbacteria bacterium CG11_big_fil_rev_8_21_14_0_20_43_7]|uniref:Cell shape-determining protein MreC n=1 Tax=Candidatus Magasanikbacteria bacterium CG11_big_fil_rev_8_21_14_0_20_43_7 TaxID=1974654 RepID=A0A2H0N5L7_9BACT|nr:MAG: hypothetical protein COV60_00600 [Candidatus Magasanikbacteria bacterium CG11_big_fil_rev_8_21_14_0_20_43_7]